MSTEAIENPTPTESKWVKDTRTRMRVFNGDIFDIIHERYAKDNKEWHDEYLAYNFIHLNSLAYFDDEISNDEYQKWIKEYDTNLAKLVTKEQTNKKAFPED